MNPRPATLSLLLLLSCCTLVSGCGSQKEMHTFNKATNGLDNGGSYASDEAAKTSAQEPAAAAAGGERAEPVTAQLVQQASSVPRKIIYNATVDLIAENFPSAEKKLMALIKSHKGYVAGRDVSGASGEPRKGNWKVRVPVDQYDSFLSKVTGLGEVTNVHTDSQDVSEEFYDLQARISNKQVEEKRLLQHLQRTTARLTDILAVEKELSRVRGEIESMQGRLRVLSNLTALTTVTVTMSEVKEYVPSQPVSFSAQISGAFQSSLHQLRDLGKGLVLMLVALVPWLLVMAVVAFPVWRSTRRFLIRNTEVPQDE